MANILVLNAKVPFTSGGAEVLSRTLVAELKSRGHNADLVELPFSVSPKDGLLQQAAIWRALDLNEFAGQKIDLVIGTKFPCYYAAHPNKSVWLVHQYRQIYDLYGTRFSDSSDDPRDEALRSRLVEGDNKVIGECKFVSAISQNVARRLSQFNNIEAEVLYPPLPLQGKYKDGSVADYILSVGRICSIKRVDLMLKSLPMIHNFVKLKIVGTPDEAGVMDYLQNEIDKHHLWERVEFLGRVSDEELVDLYSNALCVYYAPFQEDYGYVTLEAFASSKPVIAATDSGGVLEFVSHEDNGLVAEPNYDSMSKAVNRLAEDKDLSVKLGRAGRKLIELLELDTRSWDHVISRLLSPLSLEEKHLGLAVN